MPKITKRIVDQLKPSGASDQFVWDSELRGFGIRVKRKTGAASYLINYRTPEGRQRRLAFAKIGTLTPEEARRKAIRHLADIANGVDPSGERHLARATMTVGDLCDRYMEAADSGLVMTRFGRPKRASTILIDRGRVARHIKPCIGQIAITKLTRADVQRMVDRITQGKTAGAFKTKPRGKAVVTGGAGTAARVVEFFGGIWTWAGRRGLVSAPNPVRGGERAARGTRDRILSDAELARLGGTLDEMQVRYPHATAVIRLIAMTGMRYDEAQGLQWCEIDLARRCLVLKETKTGRSTRPLGDSAAEFLVALRPHNERGWVFPNAKGTRPADLERQIAGLFNAAGLPDARSQTLRRTFASTAAAEGYSDAVVGELIGHARRGVTAVHYIRLPERILVTAANSVSARVAAAMKDQHTAVDVLALPEQGHGALVTPQFLERAAA